MEFRFPLEVEKGCQASCEVEVEISVSLQRLHGALSLPSCCELILGVTFELSQGNEALCRVDGDIGVFLNGSMTPGVPLEFQGETGLLLSCDGNIGIPLQTKQGNGPSSQEEEWKTGLLVSCGGKFNVPLEWRWVCQQLLELPKWGQIPFRGSRGKVGFLSRCCSGKGPHLSLRG